MNEKPLDQTNTPEPAETEILVNDYGETRDPAVVVDEPDRTVLLTETETIVVDKEPRIDVVPVNRPRKVYTGMWGQPELITAGLAMLAVLTVVLLYVFLVVPTNSELEKNRAERDKLEAELTLARQKYGNITDTQTHVAQLMSSVDNFESSFLPVASNGRASLYQRINGLIAGHGLVNTSGPDYSPLETLDKDTGVKTEEESGRGKYRSLFPGVYVTTTVEGPYQSIRRFIREIETGGDFIVVSAVEIEPSEVDSQRPSEPAQMQPGQPMNPAFGNPTNPSPVQAPSARQKGKMHGEVVSLRLEMAAYFRRTNVLPPAAPPTEQ